mmetsp:Transcript_6884/g.24267  ORF Transcript_6884/g.24267 Transcript_6884/m.24267 type:complete len:302 (-) Transcript_6884:21-926(-)
MARASSVLPVPGGPSKSTPRGDWAPTLVYFSGLERKSTTSSSSSLEASHPATSSNVTPVFGSIWIFDLGCSMPIGPPWPPPIPPMPPPPRRPRRKRPPSSTSGKMRLPAMPARPPPSLVGAGCTANGIDFCLNEVTSSGTSDGKISTAWRAPSVSRARSSLESAENTTRSTPSLASVSRNSETAQRAASAAFADWRFAAATVARPAKAEAAPRRLSGCAAMAVERLGAAVLGAAVGMRATRALTSVVATRATTRTRRGESCTMTRGGRGGERGGLGRSGKAGGRPRQPNASATLDESMHKG